MNLTETLSDKYYSDNLDQIDISGYITKIAKIEGEFSLKIDINKKNIVPVQVKLFPNQVKLFPNQVKYRMTVIME